VTNQYVAHQNLLKEFMKAVTREFSRVIVIPYTVGVFRDFDTAERIIHAGMKGVPDTLVLLSSGQYVFFDAKTGDATFNKNQVFFKQAVMRSCGQDRVYKLRNVESGLVVIRQFEGDDAGKTF